MDITDEETVGNLMYEVDNAIQYGEDLEPKEMAVSTWTVESVELDFFLKILTFFFFGQRKQLRREWSRSKTY